MKSLSLAAIIAATASASFAGGLQNAPDQFVQDQPQAFEPIQNERRGIGAPLIIGGLLTAAAIAFVISENNDDDDAPAD